MTGAGHHAPMLLLQTIFCATAPLVAMTNPVAEVPLFLHLVEGRSKSEAHRAALGVSLGVWAILAASGFVGEPGHGRGRVTRILTRFSDLILVAIGFQKGFTGIAEFFSLPRSG